MFSGGDLSRLALKARQNDGDKVGTVCTP